MRGVGPVVARANEAREALVERTVRRRCGLGDRRAVARDRIESARVALCSCQLCAHACGVNRWGGERGVCGAGSVGRVFAAGMETGDELELTPVYAIAFSGCDLRCRFCNTRAASWNALAGEALDPAALARGAVRAREQGARSVMILGGEPTIHVPAVLELVAALPSDLPLVWKTDGHGSATARALLAGLFDVWVVDYKFGTAACAERLAGIRHYERVIRENLLWARGDTRLIVRHVLLPGHVDCCWGPIARWLSAALPGVAVSLRSGYWPLRRAPGTPELARSVTLEEARRAEAMARESGLRLMA